MTRMRTFLATVTLVLGAVAQSPAADTKPGDAAKARLLAVCKAEKYRFTPKLREAFLVYAKGKALADLKAAGQAVPPDLLAWVEADPQVRASVYGAHAKAADVLRWLHALRMDLGKARFEKYRQLALASAIVEAKLAHKADIKPRGPVQLVIGGDPRKPVNTKQPGRTLDKNDHIINFLNEHTITEDVVVGYKEAPPKLTYDERGIAIPAAKRKRKAKKVPVFEKRTRSLYAADVIASEVLQKKFNAYMKTKGFPTSIACGERVVHWTSHNMVRGEPYKRIKEAYLLFRGAYEAKGLLPAQRDPTPTPGERLTYLIRHYEYVFPPEVKARRKWPRFPLTAPWPVLTLLVADTQPLREREERWVAFRDQGEFRTYGEYIGSIAQQFDMQSARRLKPYPFTYGTIQMMLKDGGVCGTMGNISARSHIILGIPACTASQPGHCALVAFRHDPKTDTYVCKGQQYATGGDDKTTPHRPWFFGDLVTRYHKRRGVRVPYYTRKPMVYHQSVAWAVNYGMSAYLDSLMAYAAFQLLPDSDKPAGGLDLLASGLQLDPYSFLLVDSAQAAAGSARAQIRFWQAFTATLAAVGKKPNCPTEGLYPATVKKHMFARIGALPVPKDKKAAGEVLAFLEKARCDNPSVLAAYRLALHGLPALLARTEGEFKTHLASVRSAASRANDTACAQMAAQLKAVAGCVKNRTQRRDWARTLWKLTPGHAKYFGHRYRVATDPAVLILSRLAGQKMPPEADLVQPLLDRLAEELRTSLAAERDIRACRVLAAKIKAADGALKDAEQKRRWLEGLSKVIAGKETFKPKNARQKAKPIRDPCADVVTQALEVLAKQPA